MAFLQRIGKHQARYQFEILVHDCDNFGLNKVADAGKTFYVSVERGSKRFRTKLTSPVGANGALRWFEVLSFVATLYRSAESLHYLPKYFHLRLKSTAKIKRYGRRRKLVSLQRRINLAAFASKGVRSASVIVPLQGPYEGRGRIKGQEYPDDPELRLTVRCRWMNDVGRNSSGYVECSTTDAANSDLSDSGSVSSSFNMGMDSYSVGWLIRNKALDPSQLRRHSQRKPRSVPVSVLEASASSSMSSHRAASWMRGRDRVLELQEDGDSKSRVDGLEFHEDPASLDLLAGIMDLQHLEERLQRMLEVEVAGLTTQPVQSPAAPPEVAVTSSDADPSLPTASKPTQEHKDDTPPAPPAVAIPVATAVDTGLSTALDQIPVATVASSHADADVAAAARRIEHIEHQLSRVRRLRERRYLMQLAQERNEQITQHAKSPLKPLPPLPSLGSSQPQVSTLRLPDADPTTPGSGKGLLSARSLRSNSGSAMALPDLPEPRNKSTDTPQRSASDIPLSLMIKQLADASDDQKWQPPPDIILPSASSSSPSQALTPYDHLLTSSTSVTSAPPNSRRQSIPPSLTPTSPPLSSFQRRASASSQPATSVSQNVQSPPASRSHGDDWGGGAPAAAAGSTTHVVDTELPHVHGVVSQLGLVPFNDLKQLQHHGEGHFGWTFRATYQDKPVIVKVSKKKPGRDEWSELLSFVRLPAHDNVLGLTGICCDFMFSGSPGLGIVTEYQPYSLKAFVVEKMKQRDVTNHANGTSNGSGGGSGCPGTSDIAIVASGDPSATNFSTGTVGDSGIDITHSPSTAHNVSTGQLSALDQLADAKAIETKTEAFDVVRLLRDMALGLRHLHEHGIVHRDVALRNFLVSANGRVLVCDFGLSRQVGQSADAYYRMGKDGDLPLRWLAPESLLTHKFTRMSDVWMFGVSMWEVLTAGAQVPYHEVPILNQMIMGVCTGSLKLKVPKSCPAQLRLLIETCMSLDVAARPTMNDVCDQLAALCAHQSQTGHLLVSPSVHKDMHAVMDADTSGDGQVQVSHDPSGPQQLPPMAAVASS